ncbi:hypothetical protein [Paenibacillus sp. FSL H3-0286]|uniref:hypothetical protein n=1 Tax=Paenibacillus sp. FSL H3-0286 TaxID=2921427 RepID=UPI00324535C6
MKIEKTVKSIVSKLKEYNIHHEVSGDQFTFVLAPTATIHTNNCTIEIYKDQVTVNEIPVIDIEDMISEVLAVEA